LLDSLLQEKRMAPNQGASKKKKNGYHTTAGLKVGLTEPGAWSWGFTLVVITISLGMGWINQQHVSSLFENDRHFSHLSNLEREMTFRTEMGLYYSYFKTIVVSDSINDGIYNLYRNNKTEYPLTINTLKRFNLYPELVIGVLYRGLNNLGVLRETCWTVNRGQDLDPVQSCEGLKDPPHFYLSVVWLCSGLTVSILFVLAVWLSDSLVGGLLTCACFFFNHGECTRVMWTPPLRESFAFPICLLQILAVTVTTANRRPDWRNIASIATSTSAFILCWQFAQFMLFTQSTVIFGLYLIGSLPIETLSSIIISLLIGLLHAVAMMFGNEMLFCSWLFSSLAACLIVSLLLASLFNLMPSVLKFISQGVVYLVLTVGLKAGLSKALLVQDDAHVFDIFKSKFTDFKNFNTQLYTCAVEFDFLGWEMPEKTTITLLLPAALLAVAIVTFHVTRALISQTKEKSESGLMPEPAVLYTVLQTAAYAVMAILIMRLKLFLTPHLCLLTCFLASANLVRGIFRSKEFHVGAIIALLAAMSYQGFKNISEQRQIMGEYSDLHMEEMFEWIMENTPTTAVFAGPMPTMANLLLSTDRAIVNHPHFEDVGSRERTKKVYTVYSRRSPKEVHNILTDMKVDYLVLSRPWCLSVSRGGCAITELWDLEDNENKHRSPVCPQLWKKPGPFARVFSNSEYQLLQLSPHRLNINQSASRHTQTNQRQR